MLPQLTLHADDVDDWAIRLPSRLVVWGGSLVETEF